MERFENIISQYSVSDEQIVFASQNASKTTNDVDSEEWYDAFAASLECFEEENGNV